MVRKQNKPYPDDMHQYNKELVQLLCLARVGQKMKIDIEHCSFSNGLGKLTLDEQYKVKVLDDDEEPNKYVKMHESQLFKFKNDEIQKISIFYMMKPVDPSSDQHEVIVLLESKFMANFGSEIYMNVTFKKKK